MKKILIISIGILVYTMGIAQPLSYYNGTEGLDGADLKTALHNTIDGHIQYQYSSVKQILRLSDEDPNNPYNIILMYTGWSIPKSNFASSVDSLDYWNREHVWAKSHGGFGTDPGPGTDCHALKPVDNSVNSARSYLDFDEGGNEYYDAGIPTGCYKDNDSWEPRDEVKGDVARMIFYMATRYEGTNGELDLEVVDQVNTFPSPEHGKLSTLLQWNQQDPPDAFEKNRNEVIFAWQHNRNPFIDYPEFADYIWNNTNVSPIEISTVTNSPAEPDSTSIVTISADISHSSGGTIVGATLSWGTSWNDVSNQVNMTNVGSIYSCEIPAQSPGTQVYFEIEANTVSEDKSFFGWYKVANAPFNGTITSIYDIQGQTGASPFDGQEVYAAGIVTGAFGADFFLQSGSGPWNGIFVYNSGNFPSIGDSVIIKAEVDEYYDLTELKNISEYHLISSGNPLPEPVIVPTGDMQDEKYEGILVKLQGAECVRDTSYGMWFVNDGSGDALIHNSSIYTHPYIVGSVYDITGPLKFDFGEFKIELRGPDDVEAGTDTEAPVINSVEALSATSIHVNFNEDVDETTASDISNYSLNHGITVSTASVHAFDKKKVILVVSQMPEDTHILTINNVEDLAGNPMSNVEFWFNWPANSVSEFSGNDILVYPNPGNGKINVQMPECSGNKMIISIFDLSGKSLYSEIEVAGKDYIELDLRHLENGVYFLILKDAKYRFFAKISIAK